MAFRFQTSTFRTTQNVMSGIDEYSLVLTQIDNDTDTIIAQFRMGPVGSRASLNDAINLKTAEINAAADGIPRTVKVQYGTEVIEVSPDGTRTNLTKQNAQILRDSQIPLRPTVVSVTVPTPGTISQITTATGGGSGTVVEDGVSIPYTFAVISFSTTSVDISIPTDGSSDVYINNVYATTVSRPTGIYNISLASIKNYDTVSPTTVSFVYPSTRAGAPGSYTSTVNVAWEEVVSAPITVTKITSVNGGGSGFALINFTDTQINFSVPSSGSFDVYIADQLVVTSTQPDGVYERSLAQIKAFDQTSPATISFVYPATGVDPGGAYTSTFAVSWLESISDPNNVALSTEDTVNIVLRSLRTEQEAVNIVENTLGSQSDGIILDWWEREVRPELDRLANSLAQIESDIVRLRDLADQDKVGTGIITTSPYGYLGTAILYQLYVKQAQILEESDTTPEQQVDALAALNSLVSEMFNNITPSGTPSE